MGFSVSGSAAIIFVGVMVAVGIAVPAMIGSFGSLASAQGGQVDRGVDALNTDFEIIGATYNSTSNTLDLNVSNNGSTTLGVPETSLLLDGEIPGGSNVATAINGDGTVELWLPGETLSITVDNVETKPDRVKVVAENGISRTITAAEIGGA